jgi:hypothetical protein
MRKIPHDWCLLFQPYHANLGYLTTQNSCRRMLWQCDLTNASCYLQFAITHWQCKGTHKCCTEDLVWDHGQQNNMWSHMAIGWEPTCELWFSSTWYMFLPSPSWFDAKFLSFLYPFFKKGIYGQWHWRSK